MSQNPEAARQAFENQILTKAIKDEAFRQSLIDDPRAALESQFGITVPEGVNVKVLEETSSYYYIVLPPSGETPSREVSEPELQNVALGSGWVTTCSGSTSGCDSTCSTCSSCSINCTC